VTSKKNLGLACQEYGSRWRRAGWSLFKDFIGPPLKRRWVADDNFSNL
jgi:hypothetical protein